MRFSSRGRTVPVPRPPCCLNCGASVPAAAVFCGACGQENEATPVSFVALLREAWDEFVKIDAKLLVTLRLLLTRPGFLSTEYVRGRRVAYLSPFKMYLAVSALFFLVWGFVVPFDTVRTQIAAAEKSAKIAAVQSKGAAKTAKTGSDPGASSFRYKLLSPTYVSLFGVRIPLVGLPGTVEQYRAAQSRMPAIKRDAPVTHFLTERVIRFAGDPAASAKSLFSTGLPFLLLLQLPLFAAWMRLMYFRQQRLYVEHLVFLLHTHTFFFLLIGCLFFADAAAQTFGARFPSTGRDVAEAILLLVIGAYNLLAYRRFYGQTWGKTLIKGWFLLQGYAFLLLFTSIVAAIIAFLYTLLTPG